MKREGRQHSMVRSYPITPTPWNPNPVSTGHNKSDSPPTAGLFTKVSSKPTNHSKFTGKCGQPRCNSCHVNPARKSKDKAKGTQKLRSAEDTTPGLNLDGFSAIDIWYELAYDDDYDY